MKSVPQIGIDRVSVPSRIAVDISDDTQWRGTGFTCTASLHKLAAGRKLAAIIIF